MSGVVLFSLIYTGVKITLNHDAENHYKERYTVAEN
jgi:hypothetical protein